MPQVRGLGAGDRPTFRAGYAHVFAEIGRVFTDAIIPKHDVLRIQMVRFGVGPHKKERVRDGLLPMNAVGRGKDLDLTVELGRIGQQLEPLGPGRLWVQERDSSLKPPLYATDALTQHGIGRRVGSSIRARFREVEIRFFPVNAVSRSGIEDILAGAIPKVVGARVVQSGVVAPQAQSWLRDDDLFARFGRRVDDELDGLGGLDELIIQEKLAAAAYGERLLRLQRRSQAKPHRKLSGGAIDRVAADVSRR